MRLYATILLVVAALTTSVHTKPIELSEKNWHRMLHGEWMVQFVAPWCTSCKSLAALWANYAKNAEKYDVKVAFVDITKSPALSGRFLVTSLPTIYHVINGKFRYYYGKRDNEALTNYIKLKQWKKTAPVSKWANPNSMHMGALSYFFRLSFILKEWNARLQDEYGLSAYGSYGLFVLGTIVVGGILSLILIAMLDFVSSSKKTKKRRQFKEIKQLNEQNETIDEFKATLQEDIEELIEDEEDEEEEQTIQMDMNADDENSSETEKKDADKDERIFAGEDNGHNDLVNEDDNDDDEALEQADNEDTDDGDDVDDVDENDVDEVVDERFNDRTDSNTTFVMSKNIELVPDMYEEESDEDIYHNCKLISPAPSDESKGFRKPVNATI